MSVIYVILFIFITIAFVIDVRKSILPNMLTLGGVLAGYSYHFFIHGWNGLKFAFLGSITGFIVLLLLYALGALGAGDVKLFAAIGALMGVSFIIQCMVYSILFAGIIGLFLLLVRKQVVATSHKLKNWFTAIAVYGDKETLVNMKRQKNLKFPFMYAVVPGVVMACYEAFL
ncbi:prepilin peptidase [Paenibacillus sp. SYP-B3998]|uniref:Prepilin peptidase n=1 Tax=Paenibacillus sp. SYP-B3998 TaxID=2678564 RepID=A0A6G3ZXS6_9BACL|nr:A24 family peptidase [Paenibacillus sp. SYP-B3998]NEW06494.1 prepilin peptidase [Paenibacillus sp. SYP-B3998]